MSNAPGPPVMRTGPTLGYVAREINPLVEATKDLLLFMRAEGLRADHVEVTDKGVLLHNLVDDFPAKPAIARQNAGSGPAVRPSYERDFPEE